MPLLPRPYPDEIIGSVLARACFQSGMPLKRLLQCIFGSSRSSASFLMSGDLIRLAALTGLDAMELLERHTMLPYSIAFMSGAEQNRLRAKALNPVLGEDCLGSLTKNVSHGVPFRRTCPECIADELAKFGETYWHRAHLLPAVHLCAIHGTKLQVSAIPLRGRAQSNNMALPADVPTIAENCHQELVVAGEVTSISLGALNLEVEATNEWLFRYRDSAIKKGYKLAGTAVAGKRLSMDLQRFVGRMSLADAGCDFPVRRRNSWPSLMVREKVGIPFAAPKHVLMQTFLKFAEKSDGNFEYCQPGKKVRNYELEDVRALEKIKASLQKSESNDTRFTVQGLLTQAGVWSAFRHDRSRFPQTNMFIQKFRSSNQSERQLGLRPCWRAFAKIDAL